MLNETNMTPLRCVSLCEAVSCRMHACWKQYWHSRPFNCAKFTEFVTNTGLSYIIMIMNIIANNSVLALKLFQLK